MIDEIKESPSKKSAKPEKIEAPVEDLGGLVALVKDGVTILKSPDDVEGFERLGWVKK